MAFANRIRRAASESRSSFAPAGAWHILSAEGCRPRWTANPRPQGNSTRPAFLWRNAPFHCGRIHRAFRTL